MINYQSVIDFLLTNKMNAHGDIIKHIHYTILYKNTVKLEKVNGHVVDLLPIVLKGKITASQYKNIVDMINCSINDYKKLENYYNNKIMNHLMIVNGTAISLLLVRPNLQHLYISWLAGMMIIPYVMTIESRKVSEFSNEILHSLNLNLEQYGFQLIFPSKYIDGDILLQYS